MESVNQSGIAAHALARRVVRLLDLAAFFADDTADLGGFEDLAVVVAGIALVEDREGFLAAPDFTGFATDFAPDFALGLAADLAAERGLAGLPPAD